jgi:predicted acylesterase/phospholipase RssA
MLGTSAGSWVSACLVTGTTYEALGAMPDVRVPNLKPGWLRGTARELFGHKRSPLVRASAVRLRGLRRELLSGLDHSLAEIAAASSSVPGVFAPARVGKHLYVDGGVRSMASATHAPAADHLVIVAPVAGPVLGAGGRALQALLGQEMRDWETRTGGHAHLIRPDTAIAAMVASPTHLFDKARALDVYPMAYDQGVRLLSSRPGLGRLAAA